MLERLILAQFDTAQLLLRSLQVVVRDWTIDVTFAVDQTASRKVIVATIEVRGNDKKIWGYVDQGTGAAAGGTAYVIRPKGPYPLRFRGGYQPRTTPVGKFGGPGRAVGPWVSTYQVTHPGIEPRQFTESAVAAIVGTYKQKLTAALHGR